ncbi:MAG TPA: peptide-N4-asparagine amidase [Streptosporangiaceae bacterium]|nr:peptide-N4-asparagine amidase [Streptosporangiaceae bacterium]
MAGTAAASQIETNYQNPVTALPPVSRPPVRHCTVTVMQHDFANSYGQPFTGTVTPPAACPGPWTKVVMDWTGSVAGRQYDRLAGVWLGGAEIFRTSTPEPDPAGISWHVAKDISAFIPLLDKPEPLVADLGNIVDSTYTGVYHMTMTFTYYQAQGRYRPAAHADQIVPLSQSATSAGWYTLGAGQSASATVTLPRNLTGVTAEVYARGGGCDEQWFTAVPSDLAAQDPNYLCGGGPYREVQVAVDGTPAGLAQPYPVVYTGGIVPTLWHPIPAIDAFLTQPYDIDLTPFAGRLTDGKPHTITITPYGDSDNWTVDGTLFLDTDHGAAQTTGALTSDTLTTSPDVTTSETPVPGGTQVRVATGRTWAISGYVSTSHGRVTARVSQTFDYLNTDLVTAAGADQDVHQSDQGETEISVNGSASHAASGSSTTRQAWSYPIAVNSQVVSLVDDNNYDLQATVAQGRQLSDQVAGPRGWRAVSASDDRVRAQGVLARTNGVVSQADGRDAEDYQATGPGYGARCYHHVITAEHGYVTSDRLLGCG